MTGAELADVAARLYGQQGQAAADAYKQKGQILGGTIAGIGNLIGQIPAQQREQQAQQMALQTQGLHNQVLQGQLHSQQSAEASQQKADAAVSQLARNDDGSVDLAGLHQVLTKNGVSLADQAKAISDAKIVNDSLSAGRKSRIEDRSNFAEAALSTLPKDQPIDVPSFQHMMALGRGTNLTDADIKQANDELTNGADARQLLTQWRNSGSKYNVPPKFGKLGPGEVPFNEATGATTGAAPVPSDKKTQAELASDAANPKSPTQAQSATALDLLQKPPKDSNPTEAVLDDAFQKLDAKKRLGQPLTKEEQAAYEAYKGRKLLVPSTIVNMRNQTSADKLIKVEHKDPATGKTVIEWLPQSQVQGQTFEKGTNGTVANRLASAQAVNQTGDDLIAQLSDPNVKKTLGPLMGRASKLQDFIGNPPPQFSELAGSIESYALANMGVHGMRSAQGAEMIKKLLDGHHTPESLIGAIKGLQKFSTHFMANEGIPSGAAPSSTSAPVNPFR